MRDTLSLVPQIFYDFLGRVVPGSVLIILLPLAVYGPNAAINTIFSENNITKLPLFWQIVIWLLLSYIIGFLLGGFVAKLSKILFKKKEIEIESRCKTRGIKECKLVHKFFNLPYKGKDESKDLPEIFVMHDHIRDFAPSEASRLLKLRAEKRIFQILALAGIILVCINTWFSQNNWDLDRIVMEIVLILTVFISWKRLEKMEEFYNNGVINYWLYHTTLKIHLNAQTTPSNPENSK
jgi:hypothetical protein